MPLYPLEDSKGRCCLWTLPNHPISMMSIQASEALLPIPFGCVQSREPAGLPLRERIGWNNLKELNPFLVFRPYGLSTNFGAFVFGAIDFSSGLNSCCPVMLKLCSNLYFHLIRACLSLRFEQKVVGSVSGLLRIEDIVLLSAAFLEGDLGFQNFSRLTDLIIGL